MNKKIVISSCGHCPYCKHSGAFGQIQYIPTCKKIGQLPFTQTVSGSTIYAVVADEIPDLCPLADNEEI